MHSMITRVMINFPSLRQLRSLSISSQYIFHSTSFHCLNHKLNFSNLFILLSFGNLLFQTLAFYVYDYFFLFQFNTCEQCRKQSKERGSNCHFWVLISYTYTSYPAFEGLRYHEIYYKAKTKYLTNYKTNSWIFFSIHK